MIVDSKGKMKFVKEHFNQIQTQLQNKKSRAESHFAKLLNDAKTHIGVRGEILNMERDGAIMISFCLLYDCM